MTHISAKGILCETHEEQGDGTLIRLGLHVLLILPVVLLTIGEVYHYHPDGGEGWHFVAFPPPSSPSAADPSRAGGTDHPDGPATCPLDLWASLLSTTIILLASILLPPTRGTGVADQARECAVSRTCLPLSTRAPPQPD